MVVCYTHDPFRCRDHTKKCIGRDQTCDGIEDCDDGYDETFACATEAPTTSTLYTKAPTTLSTGYTKRSTPTSTLYTKPPMPPTTWGTLC